MRQRELIYQHTKGFSPFAYTIVNEWLYFCNQYMPYLFRYHLGKKKCEYVAEFNYPFIDTVFFKMGFYENELWLLPLIGDRIVRFNLDKKNFFEYEIPKEIRGISIPYYDVFFENKKVYIIPFGNNPFLIKLDLRSNGVFKMELFKANRYNDNLNFSGAIRFGEKIYMPECNRNILLVYDIENEKIEWINTDEYSLRDTFPVKGMGNKIYFFPLNINRHIVIYDIDSNNFSEKEFPIRNLPSEEIYLVSILEEKLWIFANKQAKIYLLDRDMRIKNEISFLNYFANNETLYVSGIVFDDRFFWHGRANSPLIQVKNGVVEILDVYRDKNILELYIEMLNKNKYRIVRDKIKVGNRIYKDIISK